MYSLTLLLTLSIFILKIDGQQNLLVGGTSVTACTDIPKNGNAVAIGVGVGVGGAVALTGAALALAKIKAAAKAAGKASIPL